MRTTALWLFPAVGILIASSLLQAAPVHQWSKRFGDASYQGGNSVVVDGAGNVLVAGAFIGTVDFGGGSLTSAGTSYPDIFVAKFDGTGNHLWSRHFGSGTNISPEAWVAADGSGNVIIAGNFYGTVEIGGDPLTSAGSTDIFVAKFDANGTYVWSQSRGDSEVQRVASVAADGADNIVIAGRWGGDRPLIETPVCMFFTKFDANGNELWSSGLGCGNDANGTAVVDGSGNVIVTGIVEPTSGSYSTVAKFDAGGNVLWQQSFGGGDPSNRAFPWVAADGLGNVILAGWFEGTVDFGGGPLTSAGADVFVAQFDVTGTHAWSRRFGDAGGQGGAGVVAPAADASGNVVIAGALYGTVDFGGGPLTSAGVDVFVAEFDVAGNPVWSRRFGDAGDQQCNSVTAVGSSNFVLTGVLGGTADFGGGPLTSAGSDDIFLARFMEGPVAVLITGFAATLRNEAVEVTWDVWSDEALESFTLYRHHDTRPQVIIVTDGAFDHTTRSYVDASVVPERTYYYELVIHTRAGGDIRSAVATVTVPRFAATLGQNFPNPFRPATSIEYTLSERSNAVLGIYDAAGRLVARLDHGVREAGTHRAEWDGRDTGGRVAGSGVYFYRLEGVPGVAPRKMVRLK